jgi:heme exporter protein D
MHSLTHWLGGLNPAVWVAIVSGIFLIASSVLQNAMAFRREAHLRQDAEAQRREAAYERAKDREHALEVADAQRRHEIENVWRQERMESHAAFLRCLEQATQTIYMLSAPPHRPSEALASSLREELISRMGDLDDAYNKVGLIAGQASRDHAGTIHALVISLSHLAKKGEVMGQADHRWQRLWEEQRKYQDAARAEVGTR